MKMYLRKVAATLLVSTLLGIAVGCSNRADETIAKGIQGRVEADSMSQGSAVSVSVKRGKVTLKGAVKDNAAQQRLEQIARDEPGATGVNDETAVVAVPTQQQVHPSVPVPTADQMVNQPTTATPPEPSPNSPATALPLTPVEAAQPKPVNVPAGTTLIVTVDQSLSSKTSRAGQAFLATLAQPVTVHGKTAIPKGSSITGTVITAKEKGRIKGEGELSLSLINITVRGTNYAIQTGTLDSTEKGKGKRTAATTGGGAAGGALIGGIAGGGKGAGIGALIGATGGLIGGVLTGNKQIEIPAETALTFNLSHSLTLPPGTEK